jgi:tetratricopeptide (TPR) repeat protein
MPAKVKVAPAPLPTDPSLDLSLKPGQGLTQDVLYALLAAEMAGQRGQLDLALKTYSELAEKIDDPALAERATKVAIFARDDAKALALAQRWVSLDGKNLEARQVLATLLIHAGRTDEALTQLQVVLNSGQGTPAQRMWAVANVLSKQKDQRAALAVMDKLMTRYGHDPDAYAAYALLAMRANEMEKARKAMDKVIMSKSRPTHVGVILTYLSLLQKQGHTDEAVNWLKSAVRKKPKQTDLRLIYARLLAEAHRYKQALAEFRVLERAQPKNADVQYALGLLYLESDKVKQARARFEKVVKLDQHVDEAKFYLGEIAENDKQYDKALSWYQGVSGGEYEFDAKLRAALMLARQGRVHDALELLHHVDATPEEKSRVVRAEGEILENVGRMSEAMDVYDRALADGSYDPALLYSRAMLAERMGRLGVLERDLRRILAHDPNNSQALNALGYTLADQTDRYQEAHELIKKALALSPHDFYILDSMGWVLYRLGKLDESITYLKRAKAMRNDPEVAAHLAEVLWAKGEHKAARDIFDAALKVAPDDKKLLQVKHLFHGK